MTKRQKRILRAMDERTVAEARERFFDRILAGESAMCPVCRKKGMPRRATITAPVAAALIVLVRLYTEDPRWYSTSEDWCMHPSGDGQANNAFRDFASLSRWGLIRSKVNDDPDKKDSGLYQPTKGGIEFARGEVGVYVPLITYNDEVIEEGTDELWIKEALRKKFSYRKLMDGTL